MTVDETVIDVITMTYTYKTKHQKPHILVGNYVRCNNMAGVMRRFMKQMLIRCGNKECNNSNVDSYSMQKYGIVRQKYIGNINDDGKTKCEKINKWKICKGCKLIYYCSRKCQKIDWQNHKNFCSFV